MNEKEMIEEMAKEIRMALEFGTYENLPIHIKDRVLTGVRFYETAKILLEKYQPKIPEVSVVLSKEQNEKWLEWLEQNIEKARKETAKEIFAEIYKNLRECSIVNEGGYGWNYRGYDVNDLRIRLTKIAKEYGVEV